MNGLAKPAHGRGFSLPEVLVVVAIVGLLASLAGQSGGELLARVRLEAATRRLHQGLQRARAEAGRHGQPCGMRLHQGGWGAPLSSSLPACQRTLQRLEGPLSKWAVHVEHNFPELLRFASNGLALDGGTAVLRTAGTALQRCVVMALPLGVVRLGRYEAGSCRFDPSL
jgi:prepilin-type N-terminal cleavage/methylation domain-containing protein